MRDPLEELKNLSTAGPALPAEEVRRRGDRMRRRRTALQATGVAAVVALVAGGGAVMSGTLTSSTPPAGPAASRQTAAPMATPEPTPTQAPSAVVSPSPSSAPEPRPDAGWRTEIPAGLVQAVRASLPAAGGEVPSAEEDSSPDLPWRGLPCGSRGDGEYPDPLTSTVLPEVDERRADQLFVSVSAPAGFQARQLVVYEDGDAAAEAVAAIALQAEECAPEPDPDLPTQLRWRVDDWEVTGAEALLLGGGSFVEGTDDRTIGRTLVAVVRRGNAVLTAQLSDESSAPLDARDDPGARALLDTTTGLAERMCLFSSDGCAE